MWSLGVWALQLRGFELGPKKINICFETSRFLKDFTRTLHRYFGFLPTLWCTVFKIHGFFQDPKTA